MADTVQGKTVYNSILNRWVFGSTADGRKSSIFKNGYDDPTYMTFKIEFGEWGASILDRSLVQNGITEFSLSFNDYDQLPMGLLNCPYEGNDNQDVYWQIGANSNYQVFNRTKIYSAFQYLRSRNEDTRAKYLYYFVNGLYEIQHDYPFIFKKISGINELEKFDPVSGQRLKTPAKITLECYEGLDLKIRTLFEFYRKAAWDDVYQRWILPENMREFKMIIYVFERRVFQDVNTFNIDDKKQTILSFGKLNADIPVKAYECMPCEFNIADSISWNGDYSSSIENEDEKSKLVINVKNVKTYFKNNLFNDELSKIYNSNGRIGNNLQDRIDSIMIYDLVEEMERNNGRIDQAENIEEYSSTQFTNLTVNGAKASFLDKRILLENEEGNLNIKSYVWGHSQGGAFYNDEDEAKLAISKSDQQLIGLSEHDTGHNEYQQMVESYADYYMLDDNSRYRGGWMYSLSSGPTYDPEKSFWGNLGDNIKNVLTGTRRLMLMSGAANIQIIQNCLFDNYYIQPDSFEPISNYNNGFGKLTPKDPHLKSRTIEDQNYLEIEAEREIPSQDFSELSSREIYEQQYKDLEPGREIPEQQFNELSPEREIPSQEFSELTNRTIPTQDYRSLDESRDIPEQTYRELDPERELKQQQYKELEKARELPEQDFRELDKERIPDNELIDLLLVARSLPGFKDMTLEDIRKVPEQDLLELKDAKERSMPTFSADKSVLLDSIREIEGTNIKLLELDKDNKTIEEQALEILKQNQALSQFKISETNKEPSNEKVEKLKKMTLFTKEFVENSDKVKQSYVKNILSLKDNLKKTTIKIINSLPQNDTYVLKKGEKDTNINSVLVSQNDIDQINHNMKFLAINDNDIEKLSFQTLITLQDDLTDAVMRSQATEGLTKAAKNSIATNPSYKTREAAKHSVIEEPKKDKMKVIY